MILDKKQMTEEDIKLQYITPAIQAKWGFDRMTMETKITDGRINLKGNLITREKPGHTGCFRYFLHRLLLFPHPYYGLSGFIQGL